MTVEEVKTIEEPQQLVVVVDEVEKQKPINNSVVEISKSSSYKEESNFLSDLKDHERKAMVDLKSKLEQAILAGNKLLFKQEEIIKKDADDKCEENKGGEEATEKPAAEKLVTEEEGGLDREEQLDVVEIDSEISIWGVPLLPSKGDERTDVILLKFLRARDFNASEAFQMMKNTLQWRKDFNIDSILDEDLGTELATIAYMDGLDRENHPICYNMYGVLGDEELYKNTFEKMSTKFLRWRFQLMEKGIIQKLNLKPGGVSSMLQINDLKNAPGPSKKELRVATKKAVGLLQDNYPEFVARNIFINVPFWYYAVHAILSPFLTQRTKSKFVFARPAKVTETLLKYIPGEEIPIRYGGLKRDNDFEFSTEDGVASEVFVKAGSTKTIEIPAPEVGATLVWDLTVLGWEVKYKEEFVPSDEGSYTVIVQKSKKMSSNEDPIRNTFTNNNEAGKIVLTVENVSNKKKKLLYRFKTNNTRG